SKNDVPKHFSCRITPHIVGLQSPNLLACCYIRKDKKQCSPDLMPSWMRHNTNSAPALRRVGIYLVEGK
ncbi:MAG TPA: hypothetical protein DCG77_02580, partial [Sphingobacterium sp.]|nr:hypothetical protein [Sphingobacterium sp.]